ncbi:hypothetical protein B0T16DRAFT_410392 [Cercophora newfieldiana]|uniref:Uncharacterized protein n=1 Tax=Cercophora newfieldiana TaxID=92897 RepID=A0AA39YBI6_9PEZI|nr:hypothetical protein B0T16DRAFT_410392 [Cercophora newfieldiana]
MGSPEASSGSHSRIPVALEPDICIPCTSWRTSNFLGRETTAGDDPSEFHKAQIAKGGSRGA